VTIGIQGSMILLFSPLSFLYAGEHFLDNVSPQGYWGRSLLDLIPAILFVAPSTIIYIDL
jgi:hypothetical protein